MCALITRISTVNIAFEVFLTFLVLFNLFFYFFSKLERGYFNLILKCQLDFFLDFVSILSIGLGCIYVELMILFLVLPEFILQFIVEVF